MRRATKEGRPWAVVLGLAAVLLAAALPALANASVPGPSYAETRVKGSNLEILAGVGAERGSSETGTGGYGESYDELAVGYPLVPRGTANPVLGRPRVGSALKDDLVKPVRDAQGRILKEFPATPKAHGFPDVVDNFAAEATQFQLRSGASLYQVEGSLNGVAGRFEWIVDNGQVTHRMFVAGGTVNGVPITP